MEFLKRNIRVIFAVACVVIAGTWWWLLTTGAKPPVPPDLANVDPLVRDKVFEAVGYVRDAPGAPSMWMQLAMLYDANGFRDLARQCYQQTVKLSPSDAKAWYLLAQAQQALGESDEAMRALGRALELEPKYSPARSRYAAWQLDAGHLDEARKGYEEALRLDPASRAARAGLAQVHMQAGHPDQAIALLEAMLAEESRDPYALNLLRSAQRQAGSQTAPPQTPPGQELLPYADPWRDDMRRFATDYNAVTNSAAVLLASGQADQAVKLLEMLRKRFPSRAPVMNNLAIAYIRAGRIDEGIRTAQEGIASTPEFAALYVTLSIGLLAKGEVRGSIEQVDEALKREPRLGAALRQKAEAQARLGDFNAAAETLRHATEVVPEDLGLLMALGQTYLQLQRWPDAKATFTEYLRHDARELDAHVGLVLAAIGMDALDDAQQAIDDLAALDAHDKRLPAMREMLAKKRAGGQPSMVPSAGPLPPAISPEPTPAPAGAPGGDGATSP